MTYEITNLESGKTYQLTGAEAARLFGGKTEWKEILAGYLPHIVAVLVGERNDIKEECSQ